MNIDSALFLSHNEDFLGVKEAGGHILWLNEIRCSSPALLTLAVSRQALF